MNFKLEDEAPKEETTTPEEKTEETTEETPAPEKTAEEEKTEESN